MKRRHRFLAVSILALGTAVGARAGAQSDEARADARAAAVEGMTAFNEGRFPEAIDYFQRAESLVHAPPHLLYLARAHDKLGHIVKAREIMRRVAGERLPDGAPPAFQRAHDEAAAELPTLEARIPTVKVVLEGADAKDVVVTMDGNALNSAVVGLARPVDPGEHRFQATGNGIQSDPVALTVAERARETVTLALKPHAGATLPTAAGAAPAGAAAPVEAPTQSAAAATPPPDSAKAAADEANPLRPASYAAFAVGAIGLGVGTVFALKSHSTKTEVDGMCPNGDCPVQDRDRIVDLQDSANSQGRIAVIGFIAGGVGVAAGVTLFVLSSKKSEPSADHAFVSPWIGLGAAGVRGKF